MTQFYRENFQYRNAMLSVDSTSFVDFSITLDNFSQGIYYTQLNLGKMPTYI